MSAIRSLCLIASIVGTTAQAPAPSGAANRVGTAALTGRVTNNGQPVARVLIAITPSDHSTEFQTVTDQDGRFAFARIPAGRYLVTASRMGVGSPGTELEFAL